MVGLYAHSIQSLLLPTIGQYGVNKQCHEIVPRATSGYMLGLFVVNFINYFYSKLFKNKFKLNKIDWLHVELMP